MRCAVLSCRSLLFLHCVFASSGVQPLAFAPLHLYAVILQLLKKNAVAILTDGSGTGVCSMARLYGLQQPSGTCKYQTQLVSGSLARWAAMCNTRHSHSNSLSFLAETALRASLSSSNFHPSFLPCTYSPKSCSHRYGIRQ